MTQRTVLVTGANGYIGSQLVAALSGQKDGPQVVAMDVRQVEPARRLPGVHYCQTDVRAADLSEQFGRFKPHVVAHLASIVTPGRSSSRAFEYSVDVEGTKNVLEACLASGANKVVVSSSGAAYGYHPDNPASITESCALRGNEAFAYAHHKRLVEHMLARYRTEHPELQQVVFRIGTVLGETVKNQITDLFEKPRLMAVAGSDSPFVFVWDQDVVGCFLHAIETEHTGVYNVAGDGALTIYEIAARLNKKCLTVPAWALWAALWGLKGLRLSQYGPEQLDFLRYRPVLDNAKLKNEFGYRPKRTSAQVLDLYIEARRKQKKEVPR